MEFIHSGSPTSGKLTKVSPQTETSMAARYQTLLEVSEYIASHQQLASLLAELATSLRRVVTFDGITITLYEPETQTVRVMAADLPHGKAAPIGRQFAVADTPLRMLLETGRPYYEPNMPAPGLDFPEVYPIMRGLGVASFVATPMSTSRRPLLGALNFASFRINAYTPADMDFMVQVARQVGIALENVLNYEAATSYQEQLATERDHLRLLLDVNNAIVNHLNPKTLFEAAATRLRERLGISGIRLVMRAEASSATDDAVRIPLISRNHTLGFILIGGQIGEGNLQLLREAAGQIALALDNALSYQTIEELNLRLAEEKLYLEDEIRTQFRFEEIIGRGPALTSVLRQVETVAPSDSAVVIRGETGTGKELVARAIHDLSSRRKATFVKLNCAAIPAGLLESELFGHERGAFTGAIARRIGRFELAHGGTLFLDEIGEMPLELQPKLLRVLQEREFERLGSSRTMGVDVRIVAATNRDLLQMVRDRQFRDDLYYRLNVFPIVVPPLRERREDIPVLVRHFVQQFARRMRRQITSVPTEAMDLLTSYAWPGNVRELQNLIERAVIVSPGSVLRVPLEELRSTLTQPPSAAPANTLLRDAERDHILEALRATNWVLAGPNGAAARLGLKRSTLQFRLAKLGLTRPD